MTATPMPHSSRLAAAVVCGGQSVRMGTDKALLPIPTQLASRLHVPADAVSLLGWSLERLLQITPNVALAGARPTYRAIADTACGQGRGRSVAMLDDPVRDAGPLAGVVASLAWAESQGAAWLLTIPVDLPLLPVEVLKGLAQHVRGGTAPAVPHHCVQHDQAHWLCAAWPVAITLPVARARLDARRLALHELHTELSSLAYRPLDSASESPRRWFANLNSPEDVARLCDE